jgi:SWIM zinc finger
MLPMTTNRSVYPTAIADKCVALLCARQPNQQNMASFLTAARYLMMHGYVEMQDGQSRNGARFVVLSPDTPRFYYPVDLRAETCTCADFLRYRRPCKHICAVVLTMLAQRRFDVAARTEQRKASVK